MRRAFTEVGFYFIRNHGVPAALVDAAFAAAARFHAQPLDAKLAMPFDRNNQGYLPMRGAYHPPECGGRGAAAECQ